ncbi:MAG TPA: VWA domain-containing protein [Thermoanaerobaculia bacterium]|nr:VWA domain-containing protein [Thermoanaerobaculia bacterium]
MLEPDLHRRTRREPSFERRVVAPRGHLRRAPAARIALLLTLSGLLAPLLAAAAPAHQPRLAGFYDEWLRRVRDVASAAEVEAFLALERDVERERFIRGFWAARGREQLLRFRRNELALDQLRVRSRDEERVLRLLGKPHRVVLLPNCGGRLRDLILWVYPAWTLELQVRSGANDSAPNRGAAWAGPPLTLLFAPSSAFDPRTLRLWSHEQGFDRLAHDESFGDRTVDGVAIEDDAPDSVASTQDVLDLAAAERCVVGDDPRSALLRRALDGSLGLDRLAERFGWSPPPTDWLEAAGWSRVPSSRANLVPVLEPGRELPSRLDPTVVLSIAYPGAHARETVVAATLAVESGRFRRQAEGVILDRLTVLGDVYRGTRLEDSFATTFHVVGPEPPAGRIELDVARRLRPGRYRLRVRLAGEDDLALLREDVDLEVPVVEHAAPLPGARSGLPELTREEVVRLITFPRIELLSPGDRLLGGRATIDAVGTGGPFSAVEFRRDGELLARDDEPPFSVEVELTERRHLMSAAAYDRAGELVARDEIEIERRVDAFAVDLRVDERGRARGVASAVLEVPDAEPLDRVECWAADDLGGERLTLTLHGPPWECPLPASSGARVSWVRAVAVLEEGASAEDLVFLSGSPESVDVQLVELYVSVLDPRGRPVPGLAIADFAVRERGLEQTIVSVRGVDNLPLDAAVLMDVSSSLGRNVGRAAMSVQRFFEDILRPQDQASLLAFNHDVRQLSPFTSEVDRLRYAAIGLRAGGSTRLYDSLFYSLYTFAGLAGDGSSEAGTRRALVVLSDGSDVGSDLGFEQVLEEAVRSRVSVYPIALGSVDETTRAELDRLAEQTGGRSYAAGSVSDLDRTFERIADELRSQYLLVYRPREAASGARDWSGVEVEVLSPGALARHVRGPRR